MGYVHGAGAEDETGRGTVAGRGVWLRVEDDLELPVGERVLLSEALRAVAEEVFFQPGRDERLRAAALPLLIGLLRHACPEDTGAERADGCALPPLPEQELPRRACVLLREAPERAWALEELALRCETNRRALIAAFSRAKLPAPLQYLAQVRVARACQLLAENEQTVARIAALCGYADVAGFSHFFSRHTGKSPRQYRQDTAWLA